MQMQLKKSYSVLFVFEQFALQIIAIKKILFSTFLYLNSLQIIANTFLYLNGLHIAIKKILSSCN